MKLEVYTAGILINQKEDILIGLVVYDGTRRIWEDKIIADKGKQQPTCFTAQLKSVLTALEYIKQNHKPTSLTIYNSQEHVKTHIPPTTLNAFKYPVKVEWVAGDDNYATDLLRGRQ